MKVEQFILSVLATMPENTRRSYDARLREFCALGGAVWPSERAGRFIERASVRAASRFVSAISARNLAPQTQRVYIVLLSALYQRLKASRLVDFDIFASFVSLNFREEHRRKSPMIPFEKVSELIELPPANTHDGIRDRAMLAVLFGCGLRRSEVRMLRIGDIMLNAKGVPYLRLRATKGGRSDNQPLPAWVVEYLTPLVFLRAQQGADDTGWLYVRKSPQGYEQVGDKFIYRRFKHYCARAGLDPASSPHSARATAITKLLAEGVTHKRVAAFSRHKSVAMVEQYDRLTTGLGDNPGLGLNYK